MQIFHYNEKTNEYKALEISPTENKDGVFLSIRSGSKRSDYKERLTLKLDKQEIAYLILELEGIYRELK